MKSPILLTTVSILMGIFAIITHGCNKDDSHTTRIPVLTTSGVTSIGMTTAISGGEIISDGGTAITARGVCWSTHLTPTVADPKTNDGSGAGVFDSYISDLLPGTTYYVRAYAVNSHGIGYGSTMSFTTHTANYGSFTDTRDGTVYKTVTIGDQVWMAENLKYLPDVSSPGTGSSTTPLYYVYGYYGTDVTRAKNTSSYNHFGVLYNWPAANISCPDGWHLPEESEWDQLTDYLGGAFVAGGKLKMAGTTYWHSPNTGATNETGFSALPGGVRSVSLIHIGIGISGFWWTASEHSVDNARIRSMTYSASFATDSYFEKEIGSSVRCVKNL